VTRYAITSDIHNRLDRLQAVLRDAHHQGAKRFIDLGDTGRDPCYDLLRSTGARAVFGNYEVSGWGNLSPANQAWVRALRPVLAGDTFLAAHATPYMPDSLLAVDDVWNYLTAHNVSWSALFPRMDQDEQARWLTYAELGERDKRVCFHGHTHVQSTWRIGPSGAMLRLRGSLIPLDRRGRYIIGVGSVGQPQDGPEACYAIYDNTHQVVELRRVK
jgi:diadenosine tetraphosphatase ApaH/serine/threonine PP2A family protein phosphatase